MTGTGKRQNGRQLQMIYSLFLIRCGSIGAEDIRKMIKIFNISIEEAKIENMLQE